MHNNMVVKWGGGGGGFLAAGEKILNEGAKNKIKMGEKKGEDCIKNAGKDINNALLGVKI